MSESNHKLTGKTRLVQESRDGLIYVQVEEEYVYTNLYHRVHSDARIRWRAMTVTDMGQLGCAKVVFGNG